MRRTEMTSNLIKDRGTFDKVAGGFLHAIYGDRIGTEIGEINIRIFPHGALVQFDRQT